MDIIAFDVESTGPNPDTDRIVELALVPEGRPPKTYRFNPGLPIPPRVVAIHGITNEAVKTAPPFKQHAREIQAILAGATLVGYRSRKFDAMIVDAELRRAGQPGLDFTKVAEIDVYSLWEHLEPRSLGGAAKRWLGEEHRGVHSAASDAAVALKIWRRMSSMTGMSDADGIRHSKPHTEVDRAGRFLRDTDGSIVYNFGNHLRKRVSDDLPVLDWMIDKADFPQETKEIARRLRANGGKL